jgi:hypothetical protein
MHPSVLLRLAAVQQQELLAVVAQLLHRTDVDL